MFKKEKNITEREESYLLSLLNSWHIIQLVFIPKNGFFKLCFCSISFVFVSIDFLK
jgi:hypothetical protein